MIGGYHILLVNGHTKRIPGLYIKEPKPS
jgi:hypothetical protein